MGCIKNTLLGTLKFNGKTAASSTQAGGVMAGSAAPAMVSATLASFVSETGNRRVRVWGY